MPQAIELKNPHEVRVAGDSVADEVEVAKIIADFNSDGVIPDISIDEKGELIDGINALEAAKRLNQQMVAVSIVHQEKHDGIQIIQIPIELLDPHPLNTQIYGENEDVSALAESIASHGLQETFTVTPNGDRYTVIHGHRRRLACIQAGIKIVPAKLKNFSCSEDAVAALLSGNEYREKTIEQKAREFLAWQEIEKERAKSRKGKMGQGEGATRDILAKRVGLGSGVNAEHAVQALQALDDTADAEAGTYRHEMHQKLKSCLSKTRGVDAAYQLIKPTEGRGQRAEGRRENTWIPQVGDRIRITNGSYKNRTAEVTVVLTFGAMCWIEGTPEERREQIAFKDMESVQSTVNSQQSIVNGQQSTVKAETKLKQQKLGLGNGSQTLPDVRRNEGFEPTESMQASSVNLSVVGDGIVGEVVIALLKLTPKQLSEAMSRASSDLSTPQIEAIVQGLQIAHRVEVAA
ncbi:ParB/RepB/Spo0J family partition protein [Anabaena sp. CCY 9910]|uniref:ParB/RepB/Spo0J family partition protein n=1 Tax=Anabaena sp. CCY 9910 TaxID=3103870 RepID=UPI0039E0F6D8